MFNHKWVHSPNHAILHSIFALSCFAWIAYPLCIPRRKLSPNINAALSHSEIMWTKNERRREGKHQRVTYFRLNKFHTSLCATRHRRPLLLLVLVAIKTLTDTAVESSCSSVDFFFFFLMQNISFCVSCAHTNQSAMRRIYLYCPLILVSIVSRHGSK